MYALVVYMKSSQAMKPKVAGVNLVYASYIN